MAQTLQQLVLDTLDANGIISDTRSLVLPGATKPAEANDDQIIILGALNSLLSRQVGLRSVSPGYPRLSWVSDDFL